MRVVFFGTSPFAVPTLESLLCSHHNVVAVVTQPDRPHGRGLHESQSAVKKTVAESALGLPLLQPERARAKEFIAQIRDLNPDVLVVAAFGQILPQRLLDIPAFGGVNVHGSLLPRWRGAAPMQYSLIAGDEVTGVTTMQMAAGLDSGDILLQESLVIEPDDDIDALETKLSAIGAPLLLKTLQLLEDGHCPRIPQDETLVTFSPSLATDAGFLDWNQSAATLHNLIRGVTPRPGAFAFLNGRRLKVWRSKAVDAAGAPALPGTVLAMANSGDMGILVQAGGSTALLLQEVQPESKGRMRAADWARGARLSAGMAFDPPPQVPKT